MSQREVHVYQVGGKHSVYTLFGLNSEVGLFVIQLQIGRESRIQVNMNYLGCRSSLVLICKVVTKMAASTYMLYQLLIVWFLLSFSTPTFNLNKYKAHLAYLWFNFCTFMKYFKFLWSVQTLNLNLVSSNKCLYTSNFLITTKISLF